MSHVVTITTEVRDPLAVVAACRRLQLSEPVAGRTQLFSDEVDGLDGLLVDRTRRNILRQPR